jgi:hypothetical protein
MRQVAPSVQALARWLMAQQCDESEASEIGEAAALYPFAKLRLHLVKLIGVAGFQALLARAMALAKPEMSWLQGVVVRADGFLERVDPPIEDSEETRKGYTVLLAQLLGLLVTFIGEDMTVRLVRDVWPDAPVNNLDSAAEENPS